MQTRFMRAALGALLGILGGAILAACGGGGGSTDAFPTPKINELVLPRLALTAANAQVAAGSAALFSTDGFNTAVNAGDPERLINVVSTKSAGPSGAAKLYQRIAAQSRKAAQRLRAAKNSVQAVDKQSTESCTNGGSVTATDPDDPVPRVGQQTFVVFTQCNEAGTVLDGFLHITFTAVGADQAAGTFTTAIATNVTATTGSQVVLAQGDLSATLDTRDPAVVITSVSGDMLFEARIARVLVFSHRTTDANITERAVFGADTHVELTLGFTLSGTLVGLGDKSLSVTTPQPLVIPDGSTDPASGTLLIGGANGSSITLTVNDATHTTVSVDANDGTAATVINSTWTGLKALAVTPPV